MSLSNITSSEFNNRIGMGSKKIIHRMVFVRHGETEANINMMNNIFDANKKFLNTPLSSLGYLQALNVGDYLVNIGYKPDRVIVSRLTRAMMTSKPFINKNDDVDLPVIYDETISEYNHSNDEEIQDSNGIWLYKKEDSRQFTERINEAFSKIKSFGEVGSPKQTIIFTHSQVISRILSNSIFGNPDNSEVFFHLANGSITCIDVDEDGKYHIQAVNYTKHLDQPTGQHSPFV